MGGLAALGTLFLAVAAPTCSKSAAAPPAATPAPLAPAAADPAGAGRAGGAGDDQTLPAGVDISKLDDSAKKTFWRTVGQEASLCGKAESLLASARKDPSCRRSANAVRYVAKLADQGYTQSEIDEAIDKRYRTTEIKAIDVAGAPMRGSPNARVTLVEFADYECPHCKHFQPVLRQILDEFKGEVRLYFKHYPLPQHANARLAAEAAVAAQQQGMFWPYEEKIWDHQDELSPAELEKLAKESGLDMVKFRKDLDDPQVRAKVQKDRVDGTTLGISSTPTLFINGREYTDAKDPESLREWIKETLGQ